MQRFDALVIGAGDSGLEAASAAAAAGMSVGIVYLDPHLSQYWMPSEQIPHRARAHGPRSSHVPDYDGHALDGPDPAS